MRSQRVPRAWSRVPHACTSGPGHGAFTLSVPNSPAAQPLASGPARVIVILTTTRRSRRMAAR